MVPHAIALVLFSAIYHPGYDLPIQRPVARLFAIAYRYRFGPHLAYLLLGERVSALAGAAFIILGVFLVSIGK